MKKRFTIVCTITAVLLVLSAVIYILASKGYLVTVCVTNTLFHIYCPGCGMTRMIIALSKGEIAQALRYNALIFVSIPVFLFVYICESVVYIRNGRCSKYLDCVIICFCVLAIIFGIIRNIPLFYFLAPTVL